MRSGLLCRSGPAPRGASTSATDGQSPHTVPIRAGVDGVGCNCNGCDRAGCWSTNGDPRRSAVLRGPDPRGRKPAEVSHQHVTRDEKLPEHCAVVRPAGRAGPGRALVIAVNDPILQPEEDAIADLYEI